LKLIFPGPLGAIKVLLAFRSVDLEKRGWGVCVCGRVYWKASRPIASVTGMVMISVFTGYLLKQYLPSFLQMRTLSLREEQ
jgi:hypothetical protein